MSLMYRRVLLPKHHHLAPVHPRLLLSRTVCISGSVQEVRQQLANPRHLSGGQQEGHELHLPFQILRQRVELCALPCRFLLSRLHEQHLPRNPLRGGQLLPRPVHRDGAMPDRFLLQQHGPICATVLPRRELLPWHQPQHDPLPSRQLLPRRGVSCGPVQGVLGQHHRVGGQRLPRGQLEGPQGVQVPCRLRWRRA